MSAEAIARLLDERAIEKLLVAYGALNDAGRFDDLAALFVEDGRFARPANPDRPIVGRAAILETFRGRAPRTARHLICNVQVTFTDEGTATVRSTSVLTTKGEGGGANLSVGQFDDEVVKVDGRWLFRSRTGSSVI